jgi:hypothetical protein
MGPQGLGVGPVPEAGCEPARVMAHDRGDGHALRARSSAPPLAPRRPRPSLHPEPTRHNYRKRSWNIRLTWKFWCPMITRILRKGPIFHENRTARPA